LAKKKPGTTRFSAAWVWGCILLSAACGHAQAQSAGGKSLEPGRIEQRFKPELEPQAPAGIPLPVPTQRVPLEGPEGAFVLSAVDIEGATVYSGAELSRLYEPYLARMITVADVEHLLDAITQKYRGDGYFLSRAMAEPQSLQLGILRVRVIEGFIEKVVFEGAALGSDELLRRVARHIEAARPATMSVVERCLMLMQDLPGIDVTPRLHPRNESAGAYQLLVRIAYSPFSGLVSLDNHGTNAIGPLQATGSFVLNSLLGLGERTRVTAVTVPNRPRELQYVEIVHDEPLGTLGTRVALDGTYSNVRAGGDLSPLAETSQSRFLRLILSHPLIRERQQTLTLVAQFDYENVVLNRAVAPGFHDDLRVLRAGGTYQFEDGLGGANLVWLQISRGLAGLGASDPGAATLSRLGGRSDFTKLALEVSRRQTITDAWAVRGDLVGQKSFDPLLLTEQFGLGGDHFGRGFDPSEITGDDGAAASLEVQFTRYPGNAVLESYQLFAFYDAGATWQRQPGGNGLQSLSSAGVGVRLQFAHRLGAEVEVTRPVWQKIGSGQRRKGTEGLFSLTARF
jgi:hemolysin activation/secretion protein